MPRVNSEPAIAKGRFAPGDWKKTRSSQYSNSQIKTDVRTARCVHLLRVSMLHTRAHPTTAQPAPVMDRYSGLRLDPNSIKISHACRAAKNRIVPHANRLNTIHMSRVTPKGLFRSMESLSFTRISCRLGAKRSGHQLIMGHDSARGPCRRNANPSIRYRARIDPYTEVDPEARCWQGCSSFPASPNIHQLVFPAATGNIRGY